MKKKNGKVFCLLFFLSFDGLAFCWLGLFSDQNVCNNDDDHKMMIITTSVAFSFSSIDSFDVVGRVEAHSSVFATFAPSLFVLVFQFLEYVACNSKVSKGYVEKTSNEKHFSSRRVLRAVRRLPGTTIGKGSCGSRKTAVRRLNFVTFLEAQFVKFGTFIVVKGLDGHARLAIIDQSFVGVFVPFFFFKRIAFRSPRTVAHCRRRRRRPAASSLAVVLVASAAAVTGILCRSRRRCHGTD